MALEYFVSNLNNKIFQHSFSRSVFVNFNDDDIANWSNGSSFVYGVWEKSTILSDLIK